MDSQVVIFVLNAFFGVILFLGGVLMSRQSSEIKDLRTTVQQHREKFDDYLPKDDFTEFRRENRQNFTTVFNKLDAILEKGTPTSRSVRGDG